MTDDDTVRVIDYNASHTSFDPTAHIVTEERKTEVDTACGRTLSTITSIAGSKGGWVSDLGQTPTGDRCGNCPWDEVEDDE